MKMKNLYKYILVCAVMIWGNNVFAQTEPMYSQYMYNMLGVNPG